MSPHVMPHPHLPPPLILMAHLLLLSSSCRPTFTSHCLEVQPAFKMPPPHVRWCLQLIVKMPLVAPPPLVLSMLHRLLLADTSPPACLLFASWLSRRPCCRTATTSCPLEAPPLPCNEPHSPRQVVTTMVEARWMLAVIAWDVFKISDMGVSSDKLNNFVCH